MNRFLVVSAFAVLIVSALGPKAYATSAMQLPVSTERMTLVEGQLVDFKHAVAKCGPPKPGQTCMNLTTIRVAVTVGCVDDLAVVSDSIVDAQLNKVTLSVTAINLVNKKSALVRCIRANTKIATISVPNDLVKVDNVEVVFNREFSPVK